jgi:hypothetical protein
MGIGNLLFCKLGILWYFCFDHSTSTCCCKVYSWDHNQAHYLGLLMAGERYVQQHQKGQHKTRMHIYSLGDMLMTTIKTTSKQGNHWLSKCLGWSWWRSCRFFSQFVFVLHYDCLRTVFTMVVSPAAQNSRAQGSPGLHCTSGQNKLENNYVKIYAHFFS